MFKRSRNISLLYLLLTLLAGVIFNISLGSVNIPLEATIKSILGMKPEIDSYNYIIWNYRIPKACTATLVGGGLSLSGLLMQTLFRNPLAGPFVLGISSGAGLGAALLLMGTSVFTGIGAYSFLNDVSLSIAASIGSFLVLLVVISVASRLRDTMALLIVGLMFGSIAGALVSVLAYFSNSEQLQRYIFWSFGSVGNLSVKQIWILATIVLIGVLLSVRCIKALNALLLGEAYAKSLGVSLKTYRLLIIIATGLLAGVITAFAGPIAFVGLAVPHLTRQLFNTMEHRVLIPTVFISGAIIMLVCDTIAQLPGSASVLPINAVTSIIGAPVVIWLLIRKRRMLF